MFIRTDYLPEKLFKWNGTKWIEVDKNSTDSYTYNQAYIQHLIQKLEAGEYEIEDLSDAEQAQVEQQIEKQEQLLTEIENELGAIDYEDKNNYNTVLNRYEQQKAQLEALYKKWEEKSEAL
jgi:phosphoglycerate-specific signal transduction histidine kinase